MRRLIVTADDLGLHRGMTEGALIAHEKGIVTAVSISACGRDIEHAIEAVRPYSDLDVGIHFTLVEEQPLLPAGEVASLTGPGGGFLPSYGAFVMRWATGGIDLDEVEAELRAQVERLVSDGVRVVHANGHQHLHVLPGVIDRVIRVCDSFGITYLRTPRDAHRGGVAPRLLALRALSIVGSRARGRIAQAGLMSDERTIGIAAAGHLTTEAIVNLLPLASGVTELVTHPGVRATDIADTYSWGYDWEGETAALCDNRLRREITDAGITLCRPRDLR